MRQLNATTLNGLWAGIPTPMTEYGKIDYDALAINCARLATVGVDGIYTTDTDGEFYSIEINEFEELAAKFGAITGSLGCDVAMGVTWINTAGISARMKASCEAGIPNVHVGFPPVMALALPDVDRFWDDLAASVPDARWIHYAHPKFGPILTGRDYRQLAERHPTNFIGTKLAVPDVEKLTEILVESPDVAHFVIDRHILPGLMLGARGCYSFWVNTLPNWHRKYVDACFEGRWQDAAQMHKRFLRWEYMYIEPLRRLGYQQGTLAKARVHLTDWLVAGGQTRPPYYPVDIEAQETLKAAFDRYWAAELQDLSAVQARR